jgi:hypothetical protein
MSRHRTGHRFQSLLQHGHAGVKPVAIAVEGVDSRGQAPRFRLALLGHPLDLLGLSHQLGRGDLVVAGTLERMGGEEGEDHRTDGGARPGAQLPKGAGAPCLVVSEDIGQPAWTVVGGHFGQLGVILRHSALTCSAPSSGAAAEEARDL